MTEALNDLREKLAQLKQLAGREMDYGSKSDALQNAYILATESLKIMEGTVADGVANSPGGLDTTASSTYQTLIEIPGLKEAWESWVKANPIELSYTSPTKDAYYIAREAFAAAWRLKND